MREIVRSKTVVSLAFLVGAAASLAGAAPPAARQAPQLPAGGDDATARLEASPRHGEWVEYDAGGGDMVEAWLVYPERSDNAPVVVVIHEIFGMTDWIRAVADQLAAEGLIAIAPDLLSGKGPGGGGTSTIEEPTRAIRGLERDEVKRRLDAAAEYAMALPSATDHYGVVGFCWGGSTSFFYATAQPDLDAAVVYYGSSPDTAALAGVQAPVLGLYGGDDQRVNSTIPDARAEMQRLGKPYEVEIYDGAGHGFLRAQEGRDANLQATRRAWPRTIAFFKEHLER